jgi:hypothetical protein
MNNLIKLDIILTVAIILILFVEVWVEVQMLKVGNG